MNINPTGIGPSGGAAPEEKESVRKLREEIEKRVAQGKEEKATLERLKAHRKSIRESRTGTVLGRPVSTSIPSTDDVIKTEEAAKVLTPSSDQAEATTPANNLASRTLTKKDSTDKFSPEKTAEQQAARSLSKSIEEESSDDETEDYINKESSSDSETEQLRYQKGKGKEEGQAQKAPARQVAVESTQRPPESQATEQAQKAPARQVAAESTQRPPESQAVKSTQKSAEQQYQQQISEKFKKLVNVFIFKFDSLDENKKLVATEIENKFKLNYSKDSVEFASGTGMAITEDESKRENQFMADLDEYIKAQDGLNKVQSTRMIPIPWKQGHSQATINAFENSLQATSYLLTANRPRLSIQLLNALIQTKWAQNVINNNPDLNKKFIELYTGSLTRMNYLISLTQTEVAGMQEPPTGLTEVKYFREEYTNIQDMYKDVKAINDNPELMRIIGKNPEAKEQLRQITLLYKLVEPKLARRVINPDSNANFIELYTGFLRRMNNLISLAQAKIAGMQETPEGLTEVKYFREEYTNIQDMYKDIKAINENPDLMEIIKKHPEIEKQLQLYYLSFIDALTANNDYKLGSALQSEMKKGLMKELINKNQGLFNDSIQAFNQQMERNNAAQATLTKPVLPTAQELENAKIENKIGDLYAHIDQGNYIESFEILRELKSSKQGSEVILDSDYLLEELYIPVTMYLVEQAMQSELNIENADNNYKLIQGLKESKIGQEALQIVKMGKPTAKEILDEFERKLPKPPNTLTL